MSNRPSYEQVSAEPDRYKNHDLGHLTDYQRRSIQSQLNDNERMRNMSKIHFDEPDLSNRPSGLHLLPRMLFAGLAAYGLFSGIYGLIIIGLVGIVVAEYYQYKKRSSKIKRR